MEHILSISYGKDSLACLGAIEELGWPLDRIVHTEVWATDTIPADLPPMVDFKARADTIIMKRWGIRVEHFCAMRGGKLDTYERKFYSLNTKGKFIGIIHGFPMVRGAWCKHLKYGHEVRCSTKNAVQYLGIAADEPNRFHDLSDTKKSPLVEVGWTEAMCRNWCERNGLLSPIYNTATRGGCWFCHNQSVNQLRLFRKNYPEYWALMLKWDSDSPVSFCSDGHTVHDFDRRFQLEDEGLLFPDDRVFRWRMLDECLNYRLF